MKFAPKFLEIVKTNAPAKVSNFQKNILINGQGAAMIVAKLNAELRPHFPKVQSRIEIEGDKVLIIGSEEPNGAGCIVQYNFQPLGVLQFIKSTEV